MRAVPLLDALRSRGRVLVAIPLTLLLGLGARRVLSGLPAKVAGDALYTVLLYEVVFLVSPRARLWVAGAVALGASFAVECAQLTPYPAWLSSKHVVLRLVFGTTFGFIDLAGYAVGAVFAVGAHDLVRRRAGGGGDPGGNRTRAPGLKDQGPGR